MKYTMGSFRNYNNVIGIKNIINNYNNVHESKIKYSIDEVSFKQFSKYFIMVEYDELVMDNILDEISYLLNH